MADPGEGVAADGTIRTGAHRGRVPAIFEPVMTDAVAVVGESGASLYVYGSVANGTARPGSSDVDLLSIGLQDAAVVGQRLSARYAGLCRGVEVAAVTAADLAGDTDAAYGGRVFLRHYCVHLAGPDPSAALPAFPADARAARGFNGDLGQHLRRWRQGVESGTVAADLLGVRVARKELLAVAGWSASTTRPGRPTGHALPGAGVSWSPASPPSWASCIPGPAESATPVARKPSTPWRTMESSL